MIYPILSYGNNVLRAVAKDIGKDYKDLQKLIDDLFETMYAGNGVGLAAPQIGFSLRLFVIDGNPYSKDEPKLKDFKRVFINAEIVEENGKKWLFNEGCLSFPKLREDVYRPSEIKISYYDENFNFHQECFDGITARIVQHEYDHTRGKLFVDHLSPLKRRLLKRKLNDISKGNVDVDYKMKFSAK
ncbi:MAG: peptide deformylase [Bacteroidales bacterium]|nr:peptide deformylase [Bacteroidales bacterium]